MATSEADIKKQIKAHIDSEGGAYSTWYVGITDDPPRRLGEHGVDTGPEKAWWISREASSDTISRNVETYFIDTVGTDGGGGGGDEDSVYVYAYKKTTATNP